MAKKESKSAEEAKRKDGKKAKKAAAKPAPVEIPFNVQDLMFTVSNDMLLVRCDAASVGQLCGQPTAPRVELAWTIKPDIRKQNIEKLRKDLLQALLDLEGVQ